MINNNSNDPMNNKPKNSNTPDLAALNDIHIVVLKVSLLKLLLQDK